MLLRVPFLRLKRHRGWKVCDEEPTGVYRQLSRLDASRPSKPASQRASAIGRGANVLPRWRRLCRWRGLRCCLRSATAVRSGLFGGSSTLLSLHGHPAHMERERVGELSAILRPFPERRATQWICGRAIRDVRGRTECLQCGHQQQRPR